MRRTWRAVSVIFMPWQEEGRPQAAFLGFAPEGAKQTLLLGAYIPMTPTMNGIQAAMISTRAIEGTMPVLNMSPKV